MAKIKRDTIKVNEIIQLIPDHLLAGLSEYTKVDFQARLGSAFLAIKDILDLETGDVIKLNSEVTKPIYGYAHNKKLYQGNIGKIGKKYGIKIEKILKGDDEHG